MNTVEVLKAARAKISTPDKWTQNHAARDAQGYSAACDSPSAVCYCVLGAVWSVVGIVHAAEAEDALNRVVGDSAAVWNDEPERTHAEVLELFDKAIAAEEAKSC